MEEFKLSPSWRQCVKELLDEGLTYGSVINRDEIARRCGMEQPRTIEEKEKFDLKMMSNIENIREQLLFDHKMMLVTNRDKSYRIVHPKDQTSVAVGQGTKEIARSLQKMAVSLQNIEHSLLSDDQARKNTDAQAKVAALAMMHKSSRRELRQITQ